MLVIVNNKLAHFICVQFKYNQIENEQFDISISVKPIRFLWEQINEYFYFAYLN